MHLIGNTSDLEPMQFFESMVPKARNSEGQIFSPMNVHLYTRFEQDNKQHLLIKIEITRFKNDPKFPKIEVNALIAPDKVLIDEIENPSQKLREIMVSLSHENNKDNFMRSLAAAINLIKAAGEERGIKISDTELYWFAMLFGDDEFWQDFLNPNSKLDRTKRDSNFRNQNIEFLSNPVRMIRSKGNFENFDPTVGLVFIYCGFLLQRLKTGSSWKIKNEAIVRDCIHSCLDKVFYIDITENENDGVATASSGADNRVDNKPRPHVNSTPLRGQSKDYPAGVSNF